MSVNKKVLKYGTASVVLAVVFIVLVLAINLVVGIVAEKNNFYVDLTEEQFFNISENTEKLLEGKMDEEVKFVFFTPLDQLDANTSTKRVKNLALEYAEKYSNITIESLDLYGSPDIVRPYKQAASPLSETTIVVESSKRMAAFDMSECFVYSQDDSGNYYDMAFNGEYRFTSALLKVTREDTPVVTFITNHSTGDSQSTLGMESVLEDSGFEIKKLNLLRDPIPENTEVLILSDPQSDLIGSSGDNKESGEFDKLYSYMRDGGNMMVFADPDTPELVNLNDFLKTWGLSINYGKAVQDDQSHLPTDDSMALVAGYYLGEETTAELVSAVSAKENALLPIVDYCAEIVCNPNGLDTSRSASPLLLSSLAAYVPTNAEDNTPEGRYIPLMAAAYQNTWDELKAEQVSNYLVLCGSTEFASDENMALNTNKYANSDIIRNIVSTMTDEVIVLDIPYIEYVDTSLSAEATEKVVNDRMLPLILGLPSVVLIAALVVFIKRRHL